MQSLSVTRKAFCKAQAIAQASDATTLERDAAKVVIDCYRINGLLDREVYEVMLRYDQRALSQDRYGK